MILAFSAAIACVVNLLRPDSLEWIAARDYEILVPCPEPMGEAVAMDVPNDWPMKTGDLLIDARLPDDFSLWHVPDSMNISFDYLTPVTDEAIRQIASTRARRIIVAGDGSDPDSGEQLAREISGRGIKNVHYIAGGIPKLRSVTGNHGND